jgi:hypothetical protein
VARSRTTTTKMMVPHSPYMISTRNTRVMPTSRTKWDAKVEGVVAKKHPGWCKNRINGVATSRRVRCTAGHRRSPR